MIRSRHIRPAFRVGNYRVFAEDDVGRIAAHLDMIAQRKGGAA